MSQQDVSPKMEVEPGRKRKAENSLQKITKQAKILDDRRDATVFATTRDMQSTVESYGSLIDKLNKEIEKLNKEITDKTTTLSALQLETDNFEKRLTNLNNDIKTKNTEIQELDKELEELITAIDKAQKELDKYDIENVNSNSIEPSAMQTYFTTMYDRLTADKKDLVKQYVTTISSSLYNTLATAMAKKRLTDEEINEWRTRIKYYQTLYNKINEENKEEQENGNDTDTE